MQKQEQLKTRQIVIWQYNAAAIPARVIQATEELVQIEVGKLSGEREVRWVLRSKVEKRRRLLV